VDRIGSVQGAEARKSWERSPVGRATLARDSGAGLFQIALTLSPSGHFLPSEECPIPADSPPVLTAIEEVGWQLEHTGFVFIQTGQDSKEKFFVGGQKSTVQGEIRGIYVFRRRLDDSPSTA
jgi:hypothetical protein